MVILRDIRVRRLDPPDFSDLTPRPLDGDPQWAADEPDALHLPFDGEPSAAEQVKIRRRLLTADAAEEARVTEMAAARTRLRGVTNKTADQQALLALLNDRLAAYGE